MADDVTWHVADVRTLAPLSPPGVIVSPNPPYGERIGGHTLQGFYRALGAHLRTLHGHAAFLLCAEQVRELGMRPTWQRRLMNGPLPVTLSRFELGRARAMPRSCA